MQATASRPTRCPLSLLLPSCCHARSADADNAKARMLLLESLNQFCAVRIAARFTRDHEEGQRASGWGCLRGLHIEQQLPDQLLLAFCWPSE